MEKREGDRNERMKGGAETVGEEKEEVEKMKESGRKRLQGRLREDARRSVYVTALKCYTVF